MSLDRFAWFIGGICVGAFAGGYVAFSYCYLVAVRAWA